MNVAVIFAGGSGTRMNSGSTPKQFLELNGTPIIIHTMQYFENHPQIDAICVVCIESWIDHLHKLIKRYEFKKVFAVVPGGRDGQESIRNGLYAVRDKYGVAEDTIVLIHDGVRPLITQKLITDNIECVRQNGSAVTVVPAIETIVRIDDDRHLDDVLERSRCYIARAPQSYYLREVLEAHARAIADGIGSKMVDTASLMTHYGHKLSIVEGPMENIKVTTPSDYYMCRAFLQQREDSQIWGI